MKQKIHELILKRRALVLIAFVAAWMLTVGARLVYLQVLRHQAMVDQADRQQQRTIRITPLRGTIYDRQGHELARSIEVESIFAMPAEMNDFNTIAAQLAKALNLGAATLAEKLQDRKEFVWIKRKVTAEEGQRVKLLQLPGIHFVTENKRYYPNRELAAHVLGYSGIDETGLDGVELAYDSHIRGEEGYAMVLKDARGRSYDRSQTPLYKGQDVMLTIDSAIQLVTERELAAAVQGTQARSGTAIVLDPRSGEILALANFPSFDPNAFSNSADSRRHNRAIRDLYEPGSVFKIVTYAAALEENLARPDESIDCFRGGIALAGFTIRDHKAYGLLSLREALENSSNIGAIRIGLRVGARGLAQYAEKFGFGRRTGVDLPGESRGLLRPVEKWSQVSIGAISMGQEVGVNALQMVSAMGVVANDGVWVQPHVVKTIYSRAGDVLAQMQADHHQVISRRTARTLAEMLEGVVLKGTGKRAILRGYSAAGKTGTAQQIDPLTHRYSKSRYVASFAGFAPVRNPRLAAIVVLDGPKGEHLGGTVSAPVFKRIVETVLHYMNVVPDSSDAKMAMLALNTGFAAEETAGVEADAMTPGNGAEEDPAPADPPPGNKPSPLVARVAEMPDFAGRGVRAVAQDCARLRLKLVVSGAGRVVRQDPLPGTPITPGSSCRVEFAN